MNKVFCRKRLLFSLLFTGYLILFNISCGLDTIYVVDDLIRDIDNASLPTVKHVPDCLSIEYYESYFEFEPPQLDTNPEKVYGNIRIWGTDVYYKIYKSSARLRTEADDLVSIASKSDSTSSAAEKMIQSYKFQPLRGNGYEDRTVFFPRTEKKGEKENWDSIKIRLNDYSSESAKVTVTTRNLETTDPDADPTTTFNIYRASGTVRPVRYLSEKKYFNFKSSADSSSSFSNPTSNEADVNISGSSSDSEWFVSMFAVIVGRDESYSPVYSNIVYLGSVRIPVE